MKYRKIMGGRIKGPSERGAWAELYFMVLAMTYGLKVSSPYGGFGPYDVGVENGAGPILKTQVKCTSYQWRGHYVTNICVTAVRGNGPRRTRGYAHSKYREAWHLLVDAARGAADGPMDIQACSDEGEAAKAAEQSTQRSAVRQMFRGVFQG